ncbi:HNH endonuclease [Klebsiella variicola]|uniref:HNH endonuclease n=1 Tax=Klebsiella variicola TaxID=244366 RepID=UPI0022303600|nr:HNH endonuclease [Klebsiella variicola]
MPPRAKRPCRHRGCTAVTNDVGGYCEIHRQQHAGDGWRNYQPGKTRQERGYGRPWEIKRARIMKRDKYLCQNCRRDGIATKASSVDHIIPKAHGGNRARVNERRQHVICRPCRYWRRCSAIWLLPGP